MTPLGPDFHPRHDIAVYEVAAPVGDYRGNDNPSCAPEDDFQGRLDDSVEGLFRIPRHADHEEPHDGREDHGDEARPDDFARARVAIDLGQHVTEDVGDRKKEVPGTEREAEEDTGLAGPNQVRAEQYRHEARHNEIVVAVVASISDEFWLGWFSVRGHWWTRPLLLCDPICPMRVPVLAIQIWNSAWSSDS